MRRTNWKTVSTLATLAILAGCSESAISPTESSLSPSAPALMSRAPSGTPALTMTTTAAGNVTADFTVTPKGGVFYIGRNAVVFPANSICDPATSGYGQGTWDNSCTPLASAITIHAVATSSANGTTVDFSPSLRFVPSNNPTRWVWLYVNSPSLAGTNDLSKFTILYVPTPGAAPIDESLTDPTLRTYVDKRDGTSLRRVKHFTGYTVIYLTCDPTTDPTCTGQTDPNQPQ